MQLRSTAHAQRIYESAGNFRVNSKDDIPGALETLKDRPLYAEKWAYFKMVGAPYISIVGGLKANAFCLC